MAAQIAHAALHVAGAQDGLLSLPDQTHVGVPDREDPSAPDGNVRGEANDQHPRSVLARDEQSVYAGHGALQPQLRGAPPEVASPADGQESEDEGNRSTTSDGGLHQNLHSTPKVGRMGTMGR